MSVSTPVTAPPSVQIFETVACLMSKPWCPFQNRLHPELIGLFVTLGSGRSHTRTLRPIQHSILNPGGIGIYRHGASQGVNFPYDVPFGETADRGVTRHLGNRIQVLGQQKG